MEDVPLAEGDPTNKHQRTDTTVKFLSHTVDGRNPAPPDMWETL